MLAAPAVLRVPDRREKTQLSAARSRPTVLKREPPGPRDRTHGAGGRPQQGTPLALAQLVHTDDALAVQAKSPAQAPTPAPPPPDPISTLIAASQAHFANGERELKLGHLDRARAEFDRAVDVLLESPYGARTDATLREHFDRLVDRINAHEVTALAQGDGFAETRSEPASIDELLKIATFPKPAADDETTETVRADLAATVHDVPIPQNARVLAYVELMQGRLRDYISESL